MHWTSSSDYSYRKMYHLQRDWVNEQEETDGINDKSNNLRRSRAL
jgi:hypothetical protein